MLEERIFYFAIWKMPKIDFIEFFNNGVDVEDCDHEDFFIEVAGQEINEFMFSIYWKSDIFNLKGSVKRITTNSSFSHQSQFWEIKINNENEESIDKLEFIDVDIPIERLPKDIKAQIEDMEKQLENLQNENLPTEQLEAKLKELGYEKLDENSKLLSKDIISGSEAPQREEYQVRPTTNLGINGERPTTNL